MKGDQLLASRSLPPTQCLHYRQRRQCDYTPPHSPFTTVRRRVLGVRIAPLGWPGRLTWVVNYTRQPFSLTATCCSSLRMVTDKRLRSTRVHTRNQQDLLLTRPLPTVRHAQCVLVLLAMPTALTALLPRGEPAAACVLVYCQTTFFTQLVRESFTFYNETKSLSAVCQRGHTNPVRDGWT